jgi:hypothetical protein
MARNDLADSVLALVSEASGALMIDVSLSVDIHPSVADAFEIERQELEAVRIDATEVGSAERDGDQVGGVFRHMRGSEQSASEVNESGVIDEDVGHLCPMVIRVWRVRMVSGQGRDDK